MKRKIIAGVLSAMLLTTSVSVFAQGVENFNWNNPPMQFSDVPSNAWFYNDVSQTSAAGIINGIGNGKFDPNGTLTYAEAITLMAKVHAIYNNEIDILNSYMADTTDHWAMGIYNYCVLKKLIIPDVYLEPVFNTKKFDVVISRGLMAKFFYSALPKSEFETGKVSNDLSFMPQNTGNKTIQALFKAGVMIGDNSGFRLDESITRAETAAIIHRVANPEVRVKVEAEKKDETQTTPSQQGGSQVVVTPGELQSAKPYKNIPNTNWQSDPTGGVQIYSQSGYINTIYGNHSYGCANQQEYDKVMSVIGEAYDYASQKEATRVYRGGDIKKMYVKGTFLKFYRDEVGLTNEDDMMSMGITGDFVNNMSDYLYETYVKPNGGGTNTDARNNNVYKYLFGGGYLDCDGNAHLYMLCYDYLGFSTRMIGSNKITHACGQVYVNGQWVLINQLDGKLDKATHSQLMELISGVQNEHYNYSQTDDAFIRNAAQSLKTGDTSYRPDDIMIDFTPTHDPDNRSL